MNNDYEKELINEIDTISQNMPEPPSLSERLKNFFGFYKWQTIVTVVIIAATVAASFYVYKKGDSDAIHELAMDKVNNDIEYLDNEYEKLESTKDQLETTIYNLKSNIDQNSYITKEIEEHEDQLADLSAQIASARASIEDLDEQIAQKEEQAQQVDSISAEAVGRAKTLKKGSYSCPDDFAEGSYRISGESGTILVYDSSNKLRLSQSLSVLDNNEFTIQLKEKESFEVTDDVTIQTVGSSNNQ